MDKRALVEKYVEGWLKGNTAQILSTLSPDVVIIESHGPKYVGVKKVEEWAETWFKDGKVKKWGITSFYETDNAAFLEWVFECVSKGVKYNIEGSSVVKFANGKISYIREYMTRGPIFEWSR